MDCKSNTGRMSSATDFIKKLYKILGDEALQNVIGWTPQRDRFVVKDVEEFQNSVLPAMFKHSNFASFVRQLNKYGFRKVKNFDDVGKNTWMFYHPDFQEDQRDALDKIRRNVPRPQKSSRPKSKISISPESSQANAESLHTEVASMRMQLGSIGTAVSEILSHVRLLEHSFQEAESVALQRGRALAQHDKLVAGLVEYILRVNHVNIGDLQGESSFDANINTVSLEQTQDLPKDMPRGFNSDDGSAGDGAAGSNPATPAGIEELQVRDGPKGTPTQGGTMSLERDPMVSQHKMANNSWEEYEELTPHALRLDMSRTSSQGWSAVGQTGWEGFIGSPFDGNVSAGETSGEESFFMRPLSRFLPRWVVPPHVLVVEDDAISRTLNTKFLQVFGCTIDFAVDGVEAVGKMAQEKYDLVLMDIVMPRLDGVSATSMIRKFDQQTPIISMTSNAGPTELMSYYSSGMNDILPKPFKKGVLLDMLEKHLTHLIRQERSSSLRFSPFATGIPSANNTPDGGFSSLKAGEGNLSPVDLTSPNTGEGTGSLLNLGRGSDSYNQLSNMAPGNEYSLKRDLDEEDLYGRERKRVNLTK
ncbi:hypothetical protein B0H11DRAFT_2251583 [Mycena galericulata]|nr:hypothetical protein B0H11DRAFT_2251583 [Mycena galericulata]